MHFYKRNNIEHKRFIYLFISFFGCDRVFVAACKLSLVMVSRGYSSLSCVDFSLRRLLLFWSTACRCSGFSSCSMWVLECCLSSCGAQLLCSMWDLPGPRIQLVSLTLQGGFLTPGSPEKPCITVLLLFSQ